MVDFTTFTLADAQATPVNHSFSPLIHGNNEWVWRETGTSSLLGAILIHMTKIRVKGNNQVEKYRVRMMLPVLEVVTGSNSDGYSAAPRLAYSLNSVQDIVIPLRATAQQRKDITKFMWGVLATAPWTGMANDGVTPV